MYRDDTQEKFTYPLERGRTPDTPQCPVQTHARCEGSYPGNGPASISEVRQGRMPLRPGRTPWPLCLPGRSRQRAQGHGLCPGRCCSGGGETCGSGASDRGGPDRNFGDQPRAARQGRVGLNVLGCPDGRTGGACGEHAPGGGHGGRFEP